MALGVTGKAVAKNMSLSVLVQAVSTMAGIVINLVVPKFIDTYQYAYWQTFLLYMQYVGFFHFGLIDGLVLRYSQFDYEELDKDSVRSQYYLIMFIDIGIAVFVIASAFLFFKGVARTLCIILAVSLFSEISYNYVLTLFQTTNRIKQYAKYVILYRCLYCLLLVMCICLKFTNYYWLCLAYVCADFISVLTIGLKYNKALLIGKMLPIKTVKKELKVTLSGGVKLMIASYSATLLVGFGKMIIQWKWDTVTFGNVSLAYSMTGFILQFVTAISIVLFPSLKRMDASQLPGLYKKIRSGVTPILYFCLLFYYPGSFLLGIWLPAYRDSMMYLGIWFPMIIFTTKVSLLTNNYLNAYRKEKILLTINLFVVAVSFVVYLLESVLFSNVLIILGTVVFAIMIRSIISEIVISKCINIKLTVDIILDVIVSGLFVVSIFFRNGIIGFMFYCIVFGGYVLLKRNEIKGLITFALNKIKTVMARKK